MIHKIYARRYRRLEQELREYPLGPYIDDFASLLLSQGVKKENLRIQFVIIKRFSKWLIKKKFNLVDINDYRINQFIKQYPRKQELLRRGKISTLKKFIRMLREDNIIPAVKVEIKPLTEVEKLLIRYKDYLTNAQGLSSRTISRYLYHNQKFMSFIFAKKSIDYQNITAKIIMTFIQKYASKHSAEDSSLMVCSIRSFLRFLINQKKIHHSLAECVPTVSRQKNKHVPSYLSKAELTHLLKSNKGKRPALIRNYAILLLLSRLGLRASEIVELTLDDIDWENGRLTIHGKGNKQAKLPIPIDVGKALVAYLKNVRLNFTNTRKVFISVRVPYRPFKNSVAVSSIVNRAVKKAGLNPRRKGAHLLRHTLATECLRKGATLYEIGELLRHENIDTTMIYAKVDFKRLRTLVKIWPTPHSKGGTE